MKGRGLGTPLAYHLGEGVSDGQGSGRAGAGICAFFFVASPCPHGGRRQRGKTGKRGLRAPVGTERLGAVLSGWPVLLGRVGGGLLPPLVSPAVGSREGVSGLAHQGVLPWPGPGQPLRDDVPCLWRLRRGPTWHSREQNGSMHLIEWKPPCPGTPSSRRIPLSLPNRPAGDGGPSLLLPL